MLLGPGGEGGEGGEGDDALDLDDADSDGGQQAASLRPGPVSRPGWWWLKRGPSCS